MSLPDEETSAALIGQSVHLAERMRGTYRHLPDSLRQKLIEAAIVYRCWRLQRDLAERAGPLREPALLPTVKARAYIRSIGNSGAHHLVEGEDALTYVVTIPSGLWVERVPAVEVVCTELARLLGLTVPASSTLVLDPELLTKADLSRPFWKGAKIRSVPLPCVGFRYVEPLGQTVSADAVACLDRPARDQLLGRVVFNIWVSNLRPDAAVLRYDDSAGRLRPVFFDHSRCLAGADPMRYRGILNLAEGCPRVRFKQGDQAALLRWARRAQNVDLNPLWNLATEIPGKWCGGDRRVIAEALQALEANKPLIQCAISALLKARPDSEERYHQCRRGAGCSLALACRMCDTAPAPEPRS